MKEEKKEPLPIQKLCEWLEQYDRKLFDVHTSIGKDFLRIAYECLELEESATKETD